MFHNKIPLELSKSKANAYPLFSRYQLVIESERLSLGSNYCWGSRPYGSTVKIVVSGFSDQFHQNESERQGQGIRGYDLCENLQKTNEFWKNLISLGNLISFEFRVEYKYAVDFILTKTSSRRSVSFDDKLGLYARHGIFVNDLFLLTDCLTHHNQHTEPKYDTHDEVLRVSFHVPMNDDNL